MALCSEFHILPPKTVWLGATCISQAKELTGSTGEISESRATFTSTDPVERRCQRKTDSSLLLQLAAARVCVNTPWMMHHQRRRAGTPFAAIYRH